MLVTLVGLAFLFGVLLKRVGLLPMVGFLLAGFVFNLSGFSQQLDDKQLDFSESKLKHAKLLPSPLSGLTMSDQGLSLSAWGCGVLDISAHPACR